MKYLGAVSDNKDLVTKEYVDSNADDPTPIPSGVVYGVKWDNTGTTRLGRTDSAAEFEDPVPFLASMTTIDPVSGETIYDGSGCSSPFDNVMPWSGMEIVQNESAGTLVKIPKYWFKWSRDKEGNKQLQIANQAIPGFSVSPAHADRGDGKGERDYVYVSRYMSSRTDFTSSSGHNMKNSVTMAAARTGITALGSGIYQYDYQMFWTIAMLYLVEFANTDSQRAIGAGCSNANSLTGLTDPMPYHTGYMGETVDDTLMAMQYRHIEGLWSLRIWVDGIVFLPHDGGDRTEVWVIKNPEKHSSIGTDETAIEDGVFVGERAAASGVIKDYFLPKKKGFEWALYPNSVGGADYDTFGADRAFFNASNPYLFMGGNSSFNRYYGLFCCNSFNRTSSNSSLGCRLQYLP